MKVSSMAFKFNLLENVGRFPKNSLEHVRVDVVNVNGKPRCDTRIWFLKSNDTEHHSRKGLILNREQLESLLPLLQSARQKLAELDEEPEPEEIAAPEPAPIPEPVGLDVGDLDEPF